MDLEKCYYQNFLIRHGIDKSIENKKILDIISKSNNLDIFSYLHWCIGEKYYLNRLSALEISGSCMLDLGCGTGIWSIAASHRFESIIAIDSRVDRINLAIQISDFLHVKNINFGVRDANLLNLDIRPESLDFVLIYNVLPYAKKWKELLVYSSSLLKPTGKIFLSYPDIGILGYLLMEAIQLRKPSLFLTDIKKVILNHLYLNDSNGVYLREHVVSSFIDKLGYRIQWSNDHLNHGTLPKTFFKMPFFNEILISRK